MKKVMFSILIILLSPINEFIVYAESTTPMNESELNSIESAGTYPVSVQVSDDGEIIEKTIYVTITYPKTVVSQEFAEAIDAHDIELLEEDFDMLSNEQLITLAKVRAWSTQDGHSIPIINVAKKKFGNKANFVFSTEKGTSVEITVSLVNDIVLSDSASYYNFDADIIFENIWRITIFIFCIFIMIPILLTSVLYFYLNRLYRKSYGLFYDN